MEKTRKKGSRFFFSLCIVGASVLLVAILFANGKKWYDRYQQEKEIQAIAQEIVRLKEEGSRNQSVFNTLQLPETIEREGREKLGAKKPGETVVLFPKFVDDVRGKENEGANEKRSPPFFKQWFQYFFYTPM